VSSHSIVLEERTFQVDNVSKSSCQLLFDDREFSKLFFKRRDLNISLGVSHYLITCLSAMACLFGSFVLTGTSMVGNY
jgi:hypothetical protein